MTNQESVKCLGVFQNYRLYYDGKYDDYFVLTNNFRVTRYPKRISEKLDEWCNHQISVHRKEIKKYD